MKILLSFILGLGFATTGKIIAQSPGIIPFPAFCEVKEFCFKSPKPVINYAAELLPEAEYLQKTLHDHQQGTFRLTTAKSAGKGIYLLLDTTFAPEAYSLEVGKNEIQITGGSRTGVFYGIQTLLQYSKANGLKGIACCKIQDAPRFGWRGMMLDESRHFFGKEKVKQLLEQMSRFKLNKFHWHLTDESGWRIEIKKYPQLATIGGKGNWSDPNSREIKYYKQEDIREIVAYAASLHIEVIPEIDMPGHATAANAAYPQLSGGGTPEHPDFTFNVGKEEVYSFLTDVLQEITSLFPSPYIHIGGDEVAYGIKAWETDKAIQAMMKREGLKSVKEAERYFMLRMTDSVRKLGKTPVGWDELLDLGVSSDHTLIMWWRHDRVNQLKKSLSGGYSTVLCPRRPLYFDFIQYKDHKWGRVWSGFCPLEDVYTFPDTGLANWQIPEEQLNLIRGIQANVWTERIHTPQRLDFMIYPRLCALAEAAWTKPELKNYDSFQKRMEGIYQQWDKENIYYFDARKPEKHPEPSGPQQKKRNVPMDFRD